MTQLKWGHYTDLHPDTLAQIMTATPIAILPWGALEWHGAHLPLGMDGIAAQYVAEHVVQRTGGVLLPMTWWPMTTLPHRFSLAVKTATFVAMVNDMLDSLAGAGFHTVILVSGHYAQGHEIELMKIALAMYEKSGLQVLTLPPAAVVNEDYLDHAGRWETAQTLALRPDLVRLDQLGDAPLHPREWAVLGEDPRLASAHDGQQVLDGAVDGIVAWVAQMQQPGGMAALHAWYHGRIAGYAGYADSFFKTSWEQALTDWWRQRTGVEGE
jgi:creatinine amidohydrolase